MKIRDIRATTVAEPLEAPSRHANGVHGGPFIRTIIEVVGDDGLVGLGEMGGGGASAEAVILGLAQLLRDLRGIPQQWLGAMAREISHPLAPTPETKKLPGGSLGEGRTGPRARRV